MRYGDITGFACSVCGEKTHVVDTRAARTQFGVVIRRQRVCHNGHKTRTYEVGETVFNALSKLSELSVLMHDSLDVISVFSPGTDGGGKY